MTDDSRRVVRKANDLLKVLAQVDKIRARRRKYQEDTSLSDQERQQLISRLSVVEEGLLLLLRDDPEKGEN